MQESPSPQSTPSWFISESPQQPSGPHKKHGSILRVILIVACIGLIIAAAGVWLTNQAHCISAEDYKILSGAAYAEKNQAIGMYTATVAFTAKGALESSSVETVHTLASFYGDHQQSSLRFDIKSSFSSLNDKATTQSNSIKLRKELIANGVPAAATTIQQPSYLSSEDDASTPEPSYTVSVVAERCA